MRSRLLPLALLLAALAPARTAVADDGAALRRAPYAPIAGTPIPGTMDLSPEKKAKHPGLVIAGAVVASLGAAGALTGFLLMSTDSNGCPMTNIGTEQHPNFVIVEPCPSTRRDVGMTTLGISAAVAAAGLTMVLVGIQPAADETSARARFVPSVAIGPMGGALTWRF